MYVTLLYLIFPTTLIVSYISVLLSANGFIVS